jgi:hypothetical protein
MVPEQPRLAYNISCQSFQLGWTFKKFFVPGLETQVAASFVLT